MWHASLSLRDAHTGKLIRSAGQIERAAVATLAGVGGEVEWWLFSKAGVGHLRVPVTSDELSSVPPGLRHRRRWRDGARCAFDGFWMDADPAAG